MKNLRFIHTGDWHADSDPIKQAKLKLSLDQMLDFVVRNEVNAIIHTGDIWERKQSYSSAEKSGVPLIHEYLKKLSKHVDFIFIVKGNNSHDEPGSVSLLHQLEQNIYAYENPVVLEIDKNNVCDLLKLEDVTYEVVREVDYIISLIPYPSKSFLIKEQSIDLNNFDFIQQFEQMFELIGDITQPYTCPKLLGFHGNVVGSRLSSGQSLISQDIMVSPSTLEKAKADYYALGHIHLRQEIKPKMIYAGSIYNKNWGETEQKSFEIIETGSLGVLQYTWILESARPMVTVEGEFTPQSETTDFLFNTDVAREGFADAEFRFRCKVKESDKNLLTEEKIEWLKGFFGKDAKLEFITIPNERESRSEEIMNCKTIKDEVIEYASVINVELCDSVLQKVDRLMEVLS